MSRDVSEQLEWQAAMERIDALEAKVTILEAAAEPETATGIAGHPDLTVAQMNRPQLFKHLKALGIPTPKLPVTNDQLRHLVLGHEQEAA